MTKLCKHCWRAILALQNLQESQDPSSFEFEVSDHAIHLILGGTRNPGLYLVRNALRDARSVVIRRRRRERGLFAWSLDDIADDEVAESLFAPPARATDQPEIRVEVVETISCIRAEIVPINAYAASCLQDWYEGVTLDESAKHLGISREYVKKTRSRIRDVAVSCFSGLKAA